MIENSARAIRSGFADYVAASQRVFRLALDCLSRPCRPVEFERDLLPADSPLPLVPACLALTLLDSATPVWLSPSWQRAESWLRFHRGCPICADPEKAVFILAATLAELPPLASLNQGSDRYPDSSATVIAASVLPLDGRNPLAAKGPGIDGTLMFQGHGLDRAFLSQWNTNRSKYPLGVDVFLAGDFRLAGLPRSVSLEEQPANGGQPCM